MKDSWMIGSYWYDIDAGTNAGMNSIMVQDVNNGIADYSVNNINQIQEIFERIYGK
jgi:FMN phosphatase YigB (HAD superfamily)